MSVGQRLLLVADLLVAAVLLLVAHALARMFLPADVPTPPDQFAKLALLLVGPPLLVVALGLGAAWWWRRPVVATVLLALPLLALAVLLYAMSL